MKHMKATFVILGGVAATTVAALYAWPPAASRNARNQETSEPAAPSRAAVPSATDGVTSRLHWPLGTTIRYDMDQHTVVQHASGEKMFDVSLSGSLDVTRVNATLFRFVFDAAPSQVKLVQGDDPTAEEHVRELSTALSAPWYAEAPLSGTAALRLSAEQLPFVTHAWQSLVAALELRGSATGVTQWTAREPGPLGVCDFSYRALERHRIAKETTRCSGPSPASQSSVDVSYDELSLRREFTLDQQGILKQLSLEDFFVSADMQIVPSMRSKSTLDLHFLQATRAASSDLAAWEREAAAFASTRDAQQAAEASTEKQMEQQRLGGRTVPSILAEMLQAARAPDDDSMQQRAERAYAALVAALRLQPEQHLPMIREHITKGGPLTQDLVAALQDSGTESSQQLLAKLLDDTQFSASTRVDFARGLSLTAKPSSISVEALKKFKHDAVVGQQATYGLGSNAYKLKKLDARLADEVTDSLVEEYQQTATESRRRDLLIALGNAGHDDALAALEAASADANAYVRAAAAQGLRRLASKEAQSLLGKLSQDPEVRVRRSALDALSERAPNEDVMAVVARAALSDVDFNVRASAVQTLSQWAQTNRQLAAVLEAVARKDANEDLRRIAANALQRLANSG